MESIFKPFDPHPSAFNEDGTSLRTSGQGLKACLPWAVCAPLMQAYFAFARSTQCCTKVVQLCLIHEVFLHIQWLHLKKRSSALPWWWDVSIALQLITFGRVSGDKHTGPGSIGTRPIEQYSQGLHVTLKKVSQPYVLDVIPPLTKRENEITFSHVTLVAS
jgi:hypothetical protein